MLTRSLVRSTTRYFQTIPTKTRSFHSTPAIMVQVGDSIPNVELQENSPGNKVNLSQEVATGKALIIGVPAAFSPDCTDTHIPGYLASAKIKEQKVFVVSVNDAFVMKAWGKHLDADKASGIRFIADPAADFTGALDLLFDAEVYFGNKRGKRYAMHTEDGKVTKLNVEPDPTKVTVAAADKNGF